MSVDLGTVSAPLLFFGGPYGNLQALAALEEKARLWGIPAERIVCTGDVAAYCADPQAVVDRVRDWGIHVVMGNCEESLGFDDPDCGCGFRQGGECDRLARQWFAHGLANLDAGAKTWMRSLPRRLFIDVAGRRLAVVHGGATRLNHYIFPSTPTAEKDAQLRRLDVDGIVGGHSGLPFTQFTDQGLWHNPGAIGMPANDGTPRVWYSILDPVGGPIRLTHHALDYDYRAAARRMDARGLPAGYRDGLTSGIWPSMDILPDGERAMRGIPLSPPVVLWPHRRRNAA
jgi:predicted phosphodiesterase